MAEFWAFILYTIYCSRLDVDFWGTGYIHKIVYFTNLWNPVHPEQCFLSVSMETSFIISLPVEFLYLTFKTLSLFVKIIAFINIFFQKKYSVLFISWSNSISNTLRYIIELYWMISSWSNLFNGRTNVPTLFLQQIIFLK